MHVNVEEADRSGGGSTCLSTTAFLKESGCGQAGASSAQPIIIAFPQPICRRGNRRSTYVNKVDKKGGEKAQAREGYQLFCHCI